MEILNIKSDIRNKIFIGLGIILISAVLFLVIFAVVPSRINDDFVIDYVQRKAQTSIVVGKEVKWVALVDKDQIKENKLLVKIPKSATSISVHGVKNANDLLLARPEGPSNEEKRLLAGISLALPQVNGQAKNRLTDVLNSVSAGISEGLSRVILEDQSKKAVNIVSALKKKDIPEQYVVIEYSTPAPKAVEKDISRGKEVTISADDDPKYTDILAYTKVPEIYTLKEQNKITVESKTNPGEKVDFQAHDLNENGKIDYIEWTVPHLSTQVYNVIYITKAFVLDVNKNLKTDIFDFVKEKDGVWSQIINPGEYVRVNFAEMLVDKNDISLWAKSASLSSAQIEVYAAGGYKLIARFDTVNSERMYRVLLTQLGFERFDVFDLKVLGSPVLIDYIVDPDCSAYGNCSPGGYCDGEPGSCICYTNYDLAANCATCVSGYGDCNANTSDGCEINTTSDTSHCGGCGSYCSASNVSSYNCSSSTCSISVCSGSYADCNTTYGDGCEIDTSSDTSNCGGCGGGYTCSATQAAGYSCSGGSCSITSCNSGYGDCNTTYGDGCETDTTTSTSNCGGCGSSCSATQATGYSCSASTCSITSCNSGYGDCNTTYGDGCETDTNSNTSNCGTCGTVCSATQASGYSCSMGSCSITSCNSGYGDCNSTYSDGCETDTTTSTSNCGTCGTVCSATQATGYSCSMGSCSVTSCNSGYADCNTTYSDGCEISTYTDTSNCGGCGSSCSASNVSSYTCSSGSCGISSCSAGYGDCNSTYGDGCETDTNSSTSNCGGCGSSCSASNVSSYTCSLGSCGISSCSAGYTDCNTTYGDGCEVNTASDTSNCGGCGPSFACSASNVFSYTCSAGSCGISSCNSGYADCNATYLDGCETNTSSDTSNCGGCGAPYVCSATQAASYSCSGGSCSVASCNAGYADCNATYLDGCETNTTTTSNCGSCGNSCSVNYATETCTAGSCAISSCDSGYTDCNSTYSDGCEVNTASDTSNCGGCGAGYACTPANASAACNAGVCSISSCSFNYGDCNITYSDGCEVYTYSDTSNCGSCGTVCSYAHATPSCSGSCSMGSCDSWYGDCNVNNADGCETYLYDNTSYCGTCGTSCSYSNASASCSSGSCYMGACNADYADCNANSTDGCEIYKPTDINNCGSCGTVCSVSNASEACSAGSCSISSCDSGYDDCNDMYNDGCEITLGSDTSNCGGCGTVCSVANASETCSSGNCSISSCDSGYGDCNATYSDGCEVNTNTSTSYCGNCSTSCASNHNTPVCSSGTCTTGTCDSGYNDCNAVASDGCEVQTGGTDLSNCGGCGTVCAYATASESCVAGVCTMGACDTGYYPAGTCSTYCEATTTCSSNGMCGADGLCDCGAGYYGVNCGSADSDDPAVNAGTDQNKNAQFTQAATVSDTASGVASYQWSKTSGPGTITFGSATSASTTISASQDGTYVITLAVTDNAQNDASDTFTLVWDTADPSTTASAISPAGSYSLDGGTAGGSATITLSCSAGSGTACLTIKYCTDTTNTCTPSTTYSDAVTITTGGTSYIRYFSTDAAGNEEAAGSSTIVIDATGPTGASVTSVTADSTSQLTVISATATDASNLSATPYWFAETAGGAGATSSTEWQASTSFVDTGLSPNTQYTYKVRARDSFGTASDYSATSSKYTLANVPSSLAAAGVSTTQVYVSFSDNSNPSGTQYYVENVTASTNSGWITGTNWTSSSLTCATTYTFKVKAKNGDDVSTDYTSTVTATTSACTASDRTISGGGGGGSSTPNVPPAPVPPAGGFNFTINNSGVYSESRNVALAFNAGSDVVLIDISSSPNFASNVKEVAYRDSYVYDLCQGAASCPDGSYTIYVKFLTNRGGSSSIISKSITLGTQSAAEQVAEEIVQVPQNVAKRVGLIPRQISEIPQQIIEIFNPLEEPPLVVDPLEAAVSRETPFAFMSQQVLPPKPLSDFILTALPDPVQELAQKFPEFGEVLAQSGVEKGSDIGRLRVSIIKLPDLSSMLALETGTPLAQLNEVEKQKIPDEVVFAKTSNGLVDMNTKVTFDDEGNYKQNISIVAGEEVQLIFKTTEPAESVKGRIVFKSRTASKPIFYAQGKSLLASLISLFTPNVKAQTFSDSNELYLEQFDYRDTGAGVYAADVKIPGIDGEYDIKTIVSYKDKKQKEKEFSMTAFVDPEGYVYENIGGNEARIKGAQVTLYWLNPEIQQYEVWPAEKFLQTNPQVTDKRGTYSFLVAPGYYYLEIKSPGYKSVKEKVFQVTEGSAMHINIEMKPKYFWLKPIYWETAALIGLAILFLYYKIRKHFLLEHPKNLQKKSLNY